MPRWSKRASPPSRRPWRRSASTDGARAAPPAPTLRTAPAPRADSTWIELDDAEAPLVRLQLDQDRTSFAGIEICAVDLGPAPALDPPPTAGLG
ncbi:hypothetical protein ACGFYY_39320 [Streptomyces sp. NPDC048331]|uniref:hypothetical protein n=1 Tax=Streptomyces sp. NPDC048331 TaxID=3365534 RepID=UPI00371DDA34